MNQKQLLMRIMEVSFAMTEAVLFLDTHPCSEEALEYYQKMKSLRKEAVTQYEKQFGPLTTDCVRDTASWEWTKTPWPWE